MNNKNKQKQFTIIAVIISLLLIILVITATSNPQSSQGEELGISDNVKIEEDTQVVRIISQMGGYTPRVIYANKNIPTTLEIESVNSYGCERAFRLPSLNIYEELPNNGITTFELGSPSNDILGTCSMGMYTFVIKFI